MGEFVFVETVVKARLVGLGDAVGEFVGEGVEREAIAAWLYCRRPACESVWSDCVRFEFQRFATTHLRSSADRRQDTNSVPRCEPDFRLKQRLDESNDAGDNSELDGGRFELSKARAEGVDGGEEHTRLRVVETDQLPNVGETKEQCDDEFCVFATTIVRAQTVDLLCSVYGWLVYHILLRTVECSTHRYQLLIHTFPNPLRRLHHRSPSRLRIRLEPVLPPQLHLPSSRSLRRGGSPRMLQRRNGRRDVDSYRRIRCRGEHSGREDESGLREEGVRREGGMGERMGSISWGRGSSRLCRFWCSAELDLAGVGSEVALGGRVRPGERKIRDCFPTLHDVGEGEIRRGHQELWRFGVVCRRRGSGRILGCGGNEEGNLANISYVLRSE